MGVRVEAGAGGGGTSGAWRVRAAAPRPSRGESDQCRAARRRAPSLPSAVCASSRARPLLCDSRAVLTRVVVLYDGTA